MKPQPIGGLEAISRVPSFPPSCILSLTHRLWDYILPNLWGCSGTNSSEGWDWFPWQHQTILGYQVGVLQFNSLLTLSTHIRSLRLTVQYYQTDPQRHFRHLLTGWAPDPSAILEVPTTLTIGFRCQSQVQVVTCTSDQPKRNPRFLQTLPFLGLITLLEWLTEFRETVYLLDHWFIVKGYNSGSLFWTPVPAFPTVQESFSFSFSVL